MFVPGRSFKPNVMYASKAIDYPSEAPISSSTLHSSLVRKFVNYGQKSFIAFGPGANVVKLTVVSYEIWL